MPDPSADHTRLLWVTLGTAGCAILVYFVYMAGYQAGIEATRAELRQRADDDAKEFVNAMMQQSQQEGSSEKQDASRYDDRGTIEAGRDGGDN